MDSSECISANEKEAHILSTLHEVTVHNYHALYMCTSFHNGFLIVLKCMKICICHIGRGHTTNNYYLKGYFVEKLL